MRLLVGLGNPGERYARNRHNIGFMAIDAIASRYRFSPWRARFQGLLAEGLVDGEKVLALKPHTYMNLSGQSVGEAARFFKIDPGEIIVMYDEIELVAGKVKVKKGGGSAGHNGIKSIDAHVGPEYWRLRMGIGRPETKEQVHGHVLSDFAKADEEWLGRLLAAVSDAIPHVIAGDESKFMTKVALLTRPPSPKKEAPKKEKPDAAATAAPNKNSTET
ncbi:MAG: aminoacyl-tRNA hydrolase [Rhodospirillaceae bacterium]